MHATRPQKEPREKTGESTAPNTPTITRSTTRTHLQNHHFEVGAVQLFRAGEDRGGLSRPGGAVEQQVRQLVAVDQLLDCGRIISQDTDQASGSEQNMVAHTKLW